MKRTGWKAKSGAASSPQAPVKYCLTSEQRARDSLRLKKRLSEMPEYAVEIRKNLAGRAGKQVVKTSLCTLMSKLTDRFAHSFYVEGGEAYEGNYMTLNLPSHQRMKARGISGQRTDVIARLRELDRLGFIDFTLEETQDFQGWKFRIPLERELDRFRSPKMAQGEGVRVETAHFRGVARGEGQIVFDAQPIHRSKDIGITTVNRLCIKTQIRRVDFSMFFLVALEPEGVSCREIADTFGVHRTTVSRQLKLMLSLALVERVGRLYHPLSTPCASLLKFQESVDASLIGKEVFEKSIRASIARNDSLLIQYQYRGIGPHQKRVVKAEKAIRAFKAMLKAHHAGVAPSVYMERRYV